MTIEIDGVEISIQECTKLAEAGNAEAQNQLGLELERENPYEAARWLKKSAESGFNYGQRNLAAFYEAGIGVPRDHVLAYMWLTLANANGLEYAASLRDELAEKMSQNEIFEAQKLAREHYK
jgi:hypothetical protein